MAVERGLKSSLLKVLASACLTLGACKDPEIRNLPDATYVPEGRMAFREGPQMSSEFYWCSALIYTDGKKAIYGHLTPGTENPDTPKALQIDWAGRPRVNAGNAVEETLKMAQKYGMKKEECHVIINPGREDSLQKLLEDLKKEGIKTTVNTNGVLSPTNNKKRTVYYNPTEDKLVIYNQ